MAAAARSSSQGMFSGINVTPLVDIMLVLLVIFMVTAKLIVSQTMPMDLPKAATGSEQQIVFSVAVNSKGDMTCDGKSVKSDQDLLSLAKSARAKTPELRAVIRADAELSHGKVVRIMDILKQGGVAKIAFGVDPTTLAPVK